MCACVCVCVCMCVLKDTLTTLRDMLDHNTKAPQSEAAQLTSITNLNGQTGQFGLQHWLLLATEPALLLLFICGVTCRVGHHLVVGASPVLGCWHCNCWVVGVVGDGHCDVVWVYPVKKWRRAEIILHIHTNTHTSSLSNPTLEIMSLQFTLWPTSKCMFICWPIFMIRSMSNCEGGKKVISHSMSTQMCMLLQSILEDTNFVDFYPPRISPVPVQSYHRQFSVTISSVPKPYYSVTSSDRLLLFKPHTSQWQGLK